MNEVVENIWYYHEQGYWIVIPTNGFVKNNGECVMGRGLALQTYNKYPELPKKLGAKLDEYGNIVFAFPEYRLFTFPVKRVWWEKAELQLIERSAELLKYLVDILRMNQQSLFHLPLPIYIPRVGCGNGQLKWVDVKPIFERHLFEESKFVICDNHEGK